MARQDYAQKRKRGSSASRTPAKRQSQPSPKKKPWWPRALLAILALTGLIYLLKTLIAIGPSDDGTRTEPSVAPPTQEVPRRQETPQAPPQPSASSEPTSEPETDEAAPATQTPEPVEVPEPPEAPEARFDFYDILPRSQVQAPQGVYHSTPREAPEQQRFLLQTGSFRNEADAERMRAELLLSGLPNVHTSRIEGDNGIWYRVRTGPFNNRSELIRARNQLTSLGISPLQIPLN